MASRILQDFADEDWIGDMDTRRSTTGYLFQILLKIETSTNGCPLALSTMDAEVQSSSDATRHAIWLKKLLLGPQIPIYNEQLL